MKVLQVVGNSSYGGASYLILEWCWFLVKRGCGVDVVAADPVFVAELDRIPGVRTIRDIPIPRGIAPAEDLAAFRRLLQLIGRERYEVVHTYTSIPGFLGRLAARMAGTPVIVHHQAGFLVTEFSSPLERALYTPFEYLAAWMSTRCICVSHAVAAAGRAFHTAPRQRMVTICNGIDPGPFLSASPDAGRLLRHELGLPATHHLIGSAGRLAAQKDIGTLIHAVRQLRDLVPETPFALILIGEGPDRSKLESLAQSLGLAETVRFLGFRKDIPFLLQAMDMVVTPSLWEGLSIAILEAMAAAKPIVTTAIAPNRELIEHDVTGLLVPPRSPGALAAAMARFIREPALARSCAAAARQRMLERYSLERMLRQTWELYIDLLSPEPRAASVAQVLPE